MSEKTDVEKGLGVVNDFYMEFFGNLVPGFLFLTFLLLSILYALPLFEEQSRIQDVLYRLTSVNTGGIWACVVIGTVLIAYCLGAVLYRLPLRRLDRIASFRQWYNAPWKERQDLAAQYNLDITVPIYNYCCKCLAIGLMFPLLPLQQQKKYINKSLSIKLKNILFSPWYIFSSVVLFFDKNFIVSYLPMETPDYPYQHLRSYLIARKMNHLLKYVPWCGGCTNKYENAHCCGAKSKTIIAELKLCIKSSRNPEFIRDMLRNEAAIRLLCSIWYAMCFIRNSLILGCFFFVLKIVFSYSYAKFLNQYPGGSWVEYIGGIFGMCDGYPISSFVGIIIVFGISCWVKRAIERTFHYARMREIMTILEAVYMIEHSTKNFGTRAILEVIQKRYDRFLAETKCDIAKKYF